METSLTDRDKVGVQDSVLLEDYTNEDVFVDNLKKRFKENLIYTYIGPVLISVNPYKELNIYTKKQVEEYENKHFFETSPHVFAVTDASYRSLREENIDQCILISGESGAGKTEASKKVLQFIAEVTDHQGEVEKVKDKLVQSNPVLEAFGNAKTNRNDNSSRFGKYMDVQFNVLGLPVGGEILSYLLEKSRVIYQVPGERNFHIFYQLLAGCTDAELASLMLKRSAKEYYYLHDVENSSIDSIDDKRAYEEVRKALTVIEFSNAEQDDMFKVIASILHLGNVTFNETDGISSVASTTSVENCTKLLGCEKEKIMQALTHRTREAKGDVVVSPLDKEMAIYARDALSKAIYDRLFTWLVSRLNNSLRTDDSRRIRVMGILDIYGFEVFQKNSFEQLCINFCNEKLQQLFIELTLKSEQEEYLKEGIEWQHIEYFDNKVICDLIEQRHKGIISLMDEECLRPGDPTDKTLLAKMNRSLSSHKHYLCHERADIKTQKIMGRDEFRLQHYAGPVTYNVNSFIDKNNDLLFRDLKEAMSEANNSIVISLFPISEIDSKKRPDTAITQFKNSLNNLMAILKTKEPSYIRCIKPNENKRSGEYNDELVKHQVKYLGLMENLRVRRAGFAYRRTYDLFLKRYKCLSKQTWPHYPGQAKDGVQALVVCLGYEKDDYRMGKTKIFIRFPKTLFETEDAYQMKKNDIATIIQSRWRCFAQRRKYLKMREASIVIQKWIRRFLAQRQAEKRRAAAIVIRRFIEGFITRNGPVTTINKDFVEMAKRNWLMKLSKNLPQKILNRQWPSCPESCKEASALLENYYASHMSRVYRLKLTPDRKQQFELKILAEKLFKGKKKSYSSSVPNWFKNDRVDGPDVSLEKVLDEKQRYCTPVLKYDRRGHKERERIMVVSNNFVYILDAKSSPIKIKHKLPLERLEFIITPETDSFMLVKIPEELKKEDKGDLILKLPNLIEALTIITDITKKTSMITFTESQTIEYNKPGKPGVIRFSVGNEENISKDKNGYLHIVAGP